MYQVEFRPQAALDYEKLDQLVADRLPKIVLPIAPSFRIKRMNRDIRSATKGSLESQARTVVRTFAPRVV